MSQRVGRFVPPVGTTSIYGGNNNRLLVVKHTPFIPLIYNGLSQKVYVVYVNIEKNNFVRRYEGSEVRGFRGTRIDHYLTITKSFI